MAEISPDTLRQFEFITPPPAPATAAPAAAPRPDASSVPVLTPEMLRRFDFQPKVDKIQENIGAGGWEALIHTLGAPADLADWTQDRIIPGDDYQDVIGGSGNLFWLFDKMGIRPLQVAADTDQERIARMFGSGAMSVLAPGAALGVARGVTGSQALLRGAEQFIIPGQTGIGAAGMTGLGGIAGAAGEVAAGLTPDEWDNIARLATTVGVAGAGAGAAQTVRNAATNLKIPFTGGKRVPFSPDQLEDVRQRFGQYQNRPEEVAEHIREITPATPPEQVTSYLRTRMEEIDKEFGAVEATEREIFDTMMAHMSPDSGLTPEAIGERLRTVLSSGRERVRQQENTLWEAVDPDGNIQLGDVNLASRARLIGAMPQAAKPMAGEEAAIFAVAGAMPSNVPLREVIALRSRISDEMRQELATNGETPVYRRLTMLRGAIEDSIASATTAQAVRDTAAVAAGTMSAEQTLAARLARERDAWAAERGVSLTGVAGSNAGAGAAPLRGVAGAETPPGGRPGGAAGNPSVAAATGVAEAQSRLAAATDWTKLRASIFGGPVGDVLAKQQGGVFTMPNTQVLQQFFHGGLGGYDDVRAFVRAVGGEANAVPMLRDGAVFSLRRFAENAEGVIDPGKFQNWLTNHQDALRAVPALQQEFGNLMRVQGAIDAAALNRREAVKDFVQSSLGKFMTLEDPTSVTRTVGTMLNSNKVGDSLNALVRNIGGDPNAMAGLRSAVAENVVDRFFSGTTIHGPQFQEWLTKNREALTGSGVFTPEELGLWENIARQVVELHSRPAPHVQADSMFRRLVRDSLAGAGLTGMAHFTLGTTGSVPVAASWLGITGSMALRRAGLNHVDKMIEQMLQDPALAARMLRQAPDSGLVEDWLTHVMELSMLEAPDIIHQGDE